MATSSDEEKEHKQNEIGWRQMFEHNHPTHDCPRSACLAVQLRAMQNRYKWLPSPPRCRLCFAPFEGIGSYYMRFAGKGRSNRSSNYCSACDGFIQKMHGKHGVRAEIPMSMVIVDLVGSTEMARSMKPGQHHDILSNLYREASKVLSECDGFFMDSKGDQVDGVFPPGFSGKDYALKAVQAAKQLLRMQLPPAPDNSPVNFKVGVQTGTFCIGTVEGANGVMDIKTTGDNVNITSFLAKEAGSREAFITESAYDLVKKELDLGHLESRTVDMKGVPIQVRVMRATTN